MRNLQCPSEVTADTIDISSALWFRSEYSLEYRVVFLSLLGCIYKNEAGKEDHVDESWPEKPVFVLA